MINFEMDSAMTGWESFVINESYPQVLTLYNVSFKLFTIKTYVTIRAQRISTPPYLPHGSQPFCPLQPVV